jgi:hypothetical protein
MPPTSLEQALKRIAELERNIAWANGARGDGIDRAPGFTITETRILRMLSARGDIRYECMDSLQRHMSNIRGKIKKLGLNIVVRTVVQQGYELDKGALVLKRLLAGEIQPKPRPTRNPRTPPNTQSQQIAA